MRLSRPEEKLDQLITQVFAEPGALSQADFSGYLDVAWLEALQQESYPTQDDILSFSLSARSERLAPQLFQTAQGVRSRRESHRVSVSTPYNISSVTKFMVLCLVCQLVDEGKLQFHHPASRYVTLDVANLDRITIHHLLSHTSGLVDSIGFYESHQPVSKIIAAHNQVEPDSAYFYANSNYVVLAKIIESCCQQSLSDSLQHRIVEPLGLQSTYLIGDPYDQQAHARGYRYLAEHHALIEASNLYLWGASNSRSTPTDLIRLVCAFFENTDFVSPETRSHVIKGIKPRDITFVNSQNETVVVSTSVGYGIETQTRVVNGSASDIFSISGCQDSNLTFVGYEPKQGSAVAVCCTRTSGLSAPKANGE